eukprot:489461-Amphidinium_carterae.1
MNSGGIILITATVTVPDINYVLGIQLAMRMMEFLGLRFKELVSQHYEESVQQMRQSRTEEVLVR